jgi:hypothetical protein
MSEPILAGRPPMPADKVTKSDIPLGLMQTSLRFHLCRMQHGRQINDEKKEVRLETFAFEGSSHKTWTRP